MPDLIAQGPQPNHRWRRQLPVGQRIAIGRTTPGWAVSWDEHISRQHIELSLEGNRLTVKRLDSASNPIFFQGTPQDQVRLEIGQHFVIGSTTFTLTNEPVDVTLDAPRPMAEQVFSPQYLHEFRYRDADRRISVLSQLPEIISSSANDVDLFVALVNVLLSGIRQASTAAVVSVREEQDSAMQVRVLHWDRRLLTGAPFQPSERLIRQAIESSESVLHIWGRGREGDDAQFTMVNEGEWAFATPLRTDACRGWAIYVSGGGAAPSGTIPTSGTDPSDLRDDIKFTELVATTVANLRQMQMLQRSQTSLRQFFSPVVLDVLSGQDPEVVLAPRETKVSILFCDLRGFSRTSERAADDLLGLLDRVSQALGVTTHHILENGGVVGDFHGDAAMGFWGWPLDTSDAIQRACQAALGIRSELQSASQQQDHPLKDFQLGMGIATGTAVAGKIGTKDQVKVTVFGPVVNLAARLEGMTRLLQAPILLDEESAAVIRQQVSDQIARVRRVAVVRPYGLESPLEVSELLPPVSQFGQLTNEHLAAYEHALDALLQGDWGKAFQWLHQVPAHDRVKDFLTVYIAQHNRVAPENWDGVIPLSQK